MYGQMRVVQLLTSLKLRTSANTVQALPALTSFSLLCHP